jgi:hypothetical protein
MDVKVVHMVWNRARKERAAYAADKQSHIEINPGHLIEADRIDVERCASSKSNQWFLLWSDCPS